VEDGRPKTFRIKGSKGAGWIFGWGALAIVVPVLFLAQDTKASLEVDVLQYRIDAAAAFGIFSAFAVISWVFFNRRKEIQIRPDALAIVKHSGSEVVYKFEGLRRIACEYFEPRAVSPGTGGKLILQLQNKENEEVLRYYDDHFCRPEVEALRQAIKTARPELTVVQKIID